MWFTTSTAQSLLPPPVSLKPFPKLPSPPTTTTFSTHPLRRRNPHTPTVIAFASSEDTGGLGQAVFSALESSPTSGPNPSKKAQPNDLSGSDILRALQKASAKKANTKKQNTKKRSNEFKRKTNNYNNDNATKGVEFEKVRPITIKSDWATRLADLEQRLQEFHVL